MFGALMQDQEKDKLTFVENTNIASALSRNRRDKPHVSCELCRARKVRCNFQGLSCERCISVGAECKYPTRENRRKKGSRKTSVAASPPASNTSSNRYSNAEGESARESSLEVGDDCVNQIIEDNLSMFNRDAELDNVQHAAEDWLSSYRLNHSFPDAGKGMEDAGHVDFDKLLDPSLTGVFDNKIDAACEGMLGEFPMAIDSPNVFPDILQMPPGSGVASSSLSTQSPASNFHQSPSIESLPADVMEYLENPSSISLPASSASIDSHVHLPDSSSKQLHLNNSPASDQSSGECSCTQLLAYLLEGLAARSATSGQAALDVQMIYFRETRTTCSAVVDCQKCMSASENNALLATAGCFMSTICETLVGSYLQMQNQPGGHPGSSAASSIGGGSDAGRGGGLDDDSLSTFSGVGGGVGGGGGGSGGGAGDDMWFSTYHVGSPFERMQVLRCILTVQIAEFWRFLEKVKARAGSRKGHTVLLTEAESRTAKALSSLKHGR